MKRFALLLLLAIPAAGQITDYESCQQKACYGFRPPQGAAQNGFIYQDLSQNPPRLFCGINGVWALCGSSASGINSIQQFYMAIAPNPGLNQVLGQPTTAMNGLVPMLNGIRNVQLFCNTLGTLDDSCLTNALLANTVLNIPAGTYHLNNVVNVTQAGVTFQCAPGAIFEQDNATQGFNVTGNNPVFDGCTINTNGQPNQAIEVSGVSNVTFRNGTVNNTSSTASYGIRIDHGAGVNLVNNTCNTPTSNCLQMFDSSTILVSGNKGTGHIGIASSSGSPAAGNSITVTGNNLSPSKNAFAVEIGDFSGGNFPIDNLVVTGNNCSVTSTTSSANAVHGCYSIVAHISKCVVTGNTVKAVNQFFNGPVFELGVDNCALSGNVIQAPDSNNQGYTSLQIYGGQNSITGNTIQGWGQLSGAAGLVIYPQNASGTAHNSDANIVSGNTIVGVNDSGYGINLQCNVSGSTGYNTKIVGNLITTLSGTLSRALNMEDDLAGPPNNCPVSATVDNNTFINSTVGIQAAAVTPMVLGKNDFVSVTTNLVTGGITTVNNAIHLSPIVTPSITPTSLTPSVQGLCYPTANSPITNVGCAPINAGQVTFTPTAVGWYRIINAGASGPDQGFFVAYGNWGSNFPSTRVTFSLGPVPAVKVDNLGQYAGGYNAIDGVRASQNGAGGLFLDIHIGTVAGVQPITIAFYGLAIPSADIVTSPVVGAVAGATAVATEDYTTFNTNSSFATVTTAESGQHYGDSFNATGGGFQYHGTAPSGHCLLGNNTFYTDSTACTQDIAWGTITLPTTSIASATCTAATVNVAGGVVANVLALDPVIWSADGDPTAILGYAPVATGTLTIWVYAGSGSVGAKVCNSTSAAITPGGLILDWKVVR